MHLYTRTQNYYKIIKYIYILLIYFYFLHCEPWKFQVNVFLLDQISCKLYYKAMYTQLNE